jgi:hypothetical protein
MTKVVMTKVVFYPFSLLKLYSVVKNCSRLKHQPRWGRDGGADNVFFYIYIWCSEEHLLLFFVQYLGVTPGIEPAI